MKNGNLLQVKDIDVAYGELKVLFDVTMLCDTHQIVAIVGRNGAGKTTLLKAISGFLKPTKGSIFFKGQEIVSMPSFVIAQKGVKYIPQDKMVFSDLTVRENLELSSYATGDYEWDKVLECFPKLKELLDRKGGYLSGGERQMLIIGRALLGKPAVLLLDEPMEGLAPSIVNDLLTVFTKLKEESTLILVEQNLSIVSQLADRVYAMKEGKIVAEVEDKKDIKDLIFEKIL